MPFVGRADINATKAAAQADRRTFSQGDREYLLHLTSMIRENCRKNSLMEASPRELSLDADSTIIAGAIVRLAAR
jgi:hypothetical protein